MVFTPENGVFLLLERSYGRVVFLSPFQENGRGVAPPHRPAQFLEFGRLLAFGGDRTLFLRFIGFDCGEFGPLLVDELGETLLDPFATLDRQSTRMNSSH